MLPASPLSEQREFREEGRCRKVGHVVNPDDVVVGAVAQRRRGVGLLDVIHKTVGKEGFA